MFIADAQVHIWQANSPQRPWRPGVEPPGRPSLAAEQLLAEMDAAGVQRAVLVPSTVDNDRNDLVLDAAQRYPDRYAAMGRLDLQATQTRLLLPTWCSQPGMLGLRFSFQRPWMTAALADGSIEWLWDAAEQHQIPMMIYVTHGMLHLLDHVAERHPGVRLILDHMALPIGQKDDAAFREFGKLLAIAKWPNVAVKISALPVYTNDAYPYRSLHDYVRRAYDAFGPSRLFWGSDLTRLPCTYRQCITMFTEEMPWLSGADLDAIMGRSLCHWLGWAISPADNLKGATPLANQRS